MVLDPRRKWKYIKWIVSAKYVDERILKSLDSNLRSLFEFYKKSMPQKEKEFEVSSSTSMPMGGSNSSDTMDVDELMTKQFEMAMGSSQTSLNKSMKELVLEQPTIIIDETVDESSETS
ncbi:hypothetical protein HanRHA438_Chr14g0668811 [Helianthus annuus]|nr:hypothetical protein HanRHA438_Chr14g0668811 [Helianthus annuus]